MPILDGRSILWVDNLHGESERPIKLLRESGARLDLASNVAEAIGYLSSNEYDLAVLDVDLRPREDEEFPLTVQSVQKKYDLTDAFPDHGVILAAWIFEYKRHLSFIFLSWFPERLKKYPAVGKYFDPRSTKCFRKDKTMVTPRFSSFIAHVIENQDNDH